MLILGPVELKASDYRYCASSVDNEGNRYHVWLVEFNGKLEPELPGVLDKVALVFKNRPELEGSRLRLPTIKLRMDRGTGKSIGKHLLDGAQPLLAAAKQERAVQDAEREAKAKERMRQHQIMQAGPELLDHLIAMIDLAASWYDDTNATHTEPHPSAQDETIIAARKLIDQLKG